MNERILGRRAAVVAVLVSMCLALGACLLSPGKFTSQLDVRRDGRFTYGYTGEIHLLALSKLAAMGQDKAGGEFVLQPCYNDDTLEERDCTAEEKAQQKSDWDAERASAKERQKRDSDSMKAMLGGIDPADPKAAEELAARLRKQAGWKRVDYKGDGLFDVDFGISGRLDHDFVFPTLERFPVANAFVAVVRRADGSVRIDAPGFAPTAGGDPFRSMMTMAALAEQDEKGSTDLPTMVELNGRFTLITDAPILANNTDEGPTADPAGQKLAWPVNVRTTTAPMALLKLDQR
ncbi:MAG: hypothetical protein ACREBO_12485 [Novosphingobium sp.]